MYSIAFLHLCAKNDIVIGLHYSKFLIFDRYEIYVFIKRIFFVTQSGNFIDKYLLKRFEIVELKKK